MGEWLPYDQSTISSCVFAHGGRDCWIALPHVPGITVVAQVVLYLIGVDVFGPYDALFEVNSGCAVGLTVSGLERCVMNFQQLPDFTESHGWLNGQTYSSLCSQNSPGVQRLLPLARK